MLTAHTTESAADRDVLIVGGGLAGLAFATYLARAGVEPTIVEQRAEWGEGGYGIGLWGDGYAVLNDLDCLSAVRETATDPQTVAVRASEDGVLARLSIPPDRTLLLAVHRGDLHAALRAQLPQSWLRMDTEPTRINETSDAVTVTFDDDSSETFDLVVGADGVHSSVRKQCFTDWRVRTHDTYIWSLWPRQNVDIGPDMTSVWGPGSEGFVARIGDRVGFNLAARLETPPSPPARDLLRTQAETIGWKLSTLLDGTDAEPFFDRVRDVTCEKWQTDRVVLIGDAAHAVHPISGMGASLALQDARVLAQELLTTPDGPPRRALRRFERRRRPDANRVRRAARLEAAVTFLESPLLRRVRNGLTKHTPLFERFVRRTARETGR